MDKTPWETSLDKKNTQKQIFLETWDIQVLGNADGGGGCQIFQKKALRRCKVQCY